ncbi:MAG: hypothetical protein ABFD60_10665 [Bryobacteraceae bacterium]
MLLVLAKLSAALRIWFRPDYQSDNRLARDVFKNARRAEAHSMVGNPRRLFFTRLGVLATARLALNACNRPEASDITEPQQAAHVLACCLMMNELTSSTAPLKGVADLLVHQLANHNAMAHYDFRGDLLRSLEMFERNHALLASQPGTLNLEAEFRRVTGLSPRQFIELCLVFGTPYRVMNAGSLISDDPTFFVDKNRFANMNISDAELTSFFGTVARTAQQLAEYLPTRGERPLADTTVFQSWPGIRVDSAERYYCLDVASLMDKTGRGLYWTLFGAADARTKGKLGGTYGRAFEAYLHDCVWRAGVAPDSYIASPKFSDGAEVSDGLFIDGSGIILCEYKSSVLTAEAKLSGRLDLLEPDLRKKFVTGDADGRKGIAQLSRSIERLLKGDSVTGLSSRNWSILRPVMVCLDDAMLCPGMSGYMNDQFDRAPFKRSRVRVAPLTLIDIENFEDLLPDMKAFGFGTLLEDYYHANMRSTGGGHDQLVAFRRKNIPFLDDKPEHADEKEAAFRRFFASLGARLFGEAEGAD